MKRKVFKISPYFLILFGLLLLFYMGKAIPAGVCILIGIVMIIEKVWPEKWEVEKEKPL